MCTLICVRHGQSEWNKSNRFTGWMDVPLSGHGKEEARKAGLLVKEANFKVAAAFTSFLTRAQDTLRIMLQSMQVEVPITSAWQLNERHYGDLQGYNKAEKAAEVGEEQVQIWRRSYDVAPPPLSPDDTRHPSHDSKYATINRRLLPATESLKDTVARVVPYWNRAILPVLNTQKVVLVVAHGNSLRALVKYLDGISDKDIVSLNIPTGTPFVYELSPQMSQVRRYYLGNA